MWIGTWVGWIITPVCVYTEVLPFRWPHPSLFSTSVPPCLPDTWWTKQKKKNRRKLREETLNFFLLLKKIYIHTSSVIKEKVLISNILPLSQKSGILRRNAHDSDGIEQFWGCESLNGRQRSPFFPSISYTSSIPRVHSKVRTVDPKSDCCFEQPPILAWIGSFRWLSKNKIRPTHVAHRQDAHTRSAPHARSHHARRLATRPTQRATQSPDLSIND